MYLCIPLTRPRSILQSVVTIIKACCCFFLPWRSSTQLPGPLINEASPSHSVRHTTVGRIPLDGWSARHRTWQTTTLTTDRQTSIRTRNPSKRVAADPRLRPCGHWDQHYISLATYCCTYSLSCPCQICLPSVKRNVVPSNRFVLPGVHQMLRTVCRHMHPCPQHSCCLPCEFHYVGSQPAPFQHRHDTNTTYLSHQFMTPVQLTSKGPPNRRRIRT